MLKRKFDHTKPIGVVLYLRMSSDKQNPKSPQQQRERIENIIDNRNLPWRIVAIYQDDAISGKFARTRPEFMRMMNDISSGAIAVSAILVDTIERFGRMEDLESRRKRLYNRHRVVILSADRNFSDPNAPEGRALTAIENLRAHDANRIKANDVVRGKIGSIDEGYWPGGPIPFGYRLELARIEKRHRREVKHHVLVPDELTGPIMRSLFEMSASKPSWGQDRLSSWLNERADIPDELKPFHASTIGKRLRSKLYRGILIWSEYSQGVVDDRRILEKNVDDDIICREGFCEPIAPIEILNQVDANIELRKKVRPDSGDENVGVQKRGVAYSHPLTGLVRCGHCGASMVPNSSGYTAKSGEARSYCGYMCPNGRTKSCGNTKRIKEDWLREVIIGKVVERLAPDEESIRELVEESQRMVSERQMASNLEANSRLPLLEASLDRLEEQIRGWAETLAKPSLHRRMREELEKKSGEAYATIEAIEQSIAEANAEEQVLASAVQPQEVRESLAKLHEKIVADCPTSANLELSMRIDRIECFSDGRVKSRICKIGSSPLAIQWFGGCNDDGESDDHCEVEATSHKVKPRRRALLRIEAEDGDFDALLDRIHTATDPNRFAGLPEHWFWEDEFQMPKKTSWVHENAQRVFARYNEIKATGKKPSLNALAKEYGRTRPTIARALDIATEDETTGKPEHRREPKTVKGNVEMEERLEQMHDAGSLNTEIAAELEISRSAVCNALDRLYKKRGVPRPDGRATRHG